MIATVREQAAQMKDEGVAFVGVKMGEPHSLFQGKKRWVLVVPQFLDLKVSMGRVHQESFLLGVSTDQGKSWTFLDGAPLEPGMLAKILPELPKDYRLPQKKEPEVTPDYVDLSNGGTGR
jgi:hypothetical protein